MKLNEGVEWAAHCAVVLAMLPEGASIASGRLAEFHGIPAPYLAKCMQALTRSGIASSTPGRMGGYTLGRAASEITLLDLVEAIDGDESIFRCMEIRKRGPVRSPARAYKARCGIAAAMDRAEEAWRDSLRSVTLADLVTGVLADVPPESLARSASWVVAVSRARRA